ncbi:MAG TPA: hypothetical protein DCP51_03320 [Clostridiales bacterium]|nr:MAG: hypothetical protein A2Y40_06390 [Candidatus Margulisbacteria bacterium GWF2_35_9]HAN20695.1 hypothetical protein [Clostridiales bacterium]
MENNVNDYKKRKLKKILKISAIILIAFIVLILAFYAIYEMLKKPIDTVGDNSDDISFFDADYNEDIFQNELYLRKNRNIFYYEYGTGEPLSEDNLDDFSASAKFFYNYFSIVTNGDYNEYKTLFTKDFFKNYKIPDKFTMQKIYNIEVNLYDRKTINVNEKVELYIVKYKIMENNGTFRRDVGSNIIKPLVFELYTTDQGVLINGIDFKTNIYD